MQNYVVLPDCYGCPFINVVTEYPEAGYAGHQVALEHKESVRARFNQLPKETGAHQPEALANALLLLMDGVFMVAWMIGASLSNPAAGAVEVARQLIDAHCETASGR